MGIERSYAESKARKSYAPNDQKTATSIPLAKRKLRMAARVNELIQLGRWRDDYDAQRADVMGFALVIADALSWRPQGNDFFGFMEIAVAARLAIDEATAMQALHKIDEWREEQGTAYCPLSAAQAGRMVDLTAEERLSVRMARRHKTQDGNYTSTPISTMNAVDETNAERAGRVKQDRRERDIKRKRDGRAGRVKPRHIYEAESLSKRKPWEGEGVSRATWYRKNRETGVSRTILEKEVDGLVSRKATRKGRGVKRTQSLIAKGGAARHALNIVHYTVPPNFNCERAIRWVKTMQRGAA